MTIEIHELQRVAFTEEAAGDANFAIDVTGSATYLDMPIQGTADLKLMYPALESGIQQQRKDAKASAVLGVKSAELSFTIPIGGHGVPAGDGATSPAHTDQAFLWFLKTGYGGANDSNTGTDVVSASSADTVTLTDVTAFDGGECIGWANASGKIEARSLTASAANINIRDHLSATPSAADVIYAGTTIHLTENPLTSMQFIVEGAEEDDRWLLMGGQLSGAPSFTFVQGEISTMSFTMTFADWASEPSAAITTADYLTFTPITDFVVRTVNALARTTGACLDASSVTINAAGPVYEPMRSGCGVNTIKRWVRSRVVPFATVDAVIPYEDTSWFTERDDREYYGITIQLGTAAGSIVLIEIPKAQVDNVQRTASEAIAGQTVTFSATSDSYVNSNADDDDIRYSPMRIHFL